MVVCHTGAEKMQMLLNGETAVLIAGRQCQFREVGTHRRGALLHAAK
jgi:hypothetical protein